MRRFLFRAAIILTAAALVVSGTYLTTTLLTATPLSEGCVVRVDGGETKLDVSQAENASLIAALAVRQDYPRRAATVALATAYQESGLRNLDHGDRDSLGLFQQRPSQGWGSRAQISDPYYSTQTFYDHLVAVKDYRRLPVDEAAQLVQKSADGSAYAQHEPNARALSAAFTGRSEASFSCRLTREPKPSPLAALADRADRDRPEDGERGSAPASEPARDARVPDAQGTEDSGTGDGAANRRSDDTPGNPSDREQGDAPEADAPDSAGEPNGAGRARENQPGPDQRSGGSATSDSSAQDSSAGRQPEDADRDRDDRGSEPTSPARTVQRELEHAFGGRPASGHDDGTHSDGDPENGTGGGDSGSEDADTGSGDTEESGETAPDRSMSGDGAEPGFDRAEDGEPVERSEPARPAPTEPNGPPRDVAPATDAQVSDDGTQVRVTVRDDQVGWAVAHWSVANAQRLGINEVAYDDRSWTARSSAEGWVRGKSTGGQAVRIGLG